MAINVPLVGNKPSGNGVLRGNDKIPENEDAFVKYTARGPVAAEYSHIQLKNPAASGKIVLLDLLVIFLIGTGLRIGRYDTDLTRDDGTWANATSGGANGVAHIRAQTIGSTMGTQLFYVDNVLDGSIVVPLSIPIMLLEGEGFIVVNNTVNKNLGCTFYGRDV